jgi:polysaccharide biosynthesis transport protein
MYRRRWKLVVFPTIIVTGLCVVGALQLPRKYVATTTILVQPDETLHQLDDWQMQGAFDEELRSYGEIIYSRPFVMQVMDSLRIGVNIRSEAELQPLIGEVKGMIMTERRSPSSFSMTFINSDPGLAKRGAEVVANVFIQAKLSVKNRQNALTIQFLEKKVEEIREGFESTTRSLVTAMMQNVDELPAESRSIYDGLNEVGRSIGANEVRVRSFQDNLVRIRSLSNILRTNPDALRSEGGKEPLFELQREDLPYSTELRVLVTKYDETTQRYTGKYPEIEKLEVQILTLLDRMLIATEVELSKVESQQDDLERRRSTFIEELKKSSVSSRIHQDKQSNYEINLRQYNEMKGRLEQARLKAEVESKGADQYIILDPPVYPTRPTKPNRTLLVLGGFGLALFLGIISVIVAEIFDTTVRTPQDIEVYEKPIIALLPDGTREYR